MESLVLRLGLAVGLPRDAGHHLCHEDKVDDERRSEERVLAHIENADGLVTAEEDLAVVLVESALVVAYAGHVLDDDAVVRVLLLLTVVEDVVCGDHIVDDVRLGDLLAAELLLAGEIETIVVS